MFLIKWKGSDEADLVRIIAVGNRGQFFTSPPL
jgi:hypothetical protein